MKIPKRIKNAIMKCTKYHSLASKYEREVHDWLEKNNLTEETCKDVYHNLDDIFIDCCTMTNNPECFIERIEDIEGYKYEKNKI